MRSPWERVLSSYLEKVRVRARARARVRVLSLLPREGDSHATARPHPPPSPATLTATRGTITTRSLRPSPSPPPPPSPGGGDARERSLVEQRRRAGKHRTSFPPSSLPTSHFLLTTHHSPLTTHHPPLPSLQVGLILHDLGLPPGATISFSQFVLWLSAKEPGSDDNIHIMPWSVRCGAVPPARYSMIGRTETLEADLQRLLGALHWDQALTLHPTLTPTPNPNPSPKPNADPSPKPNPRPKPKTQPRTQTQNPTPTPTPTHP